MNKTFIQKLMEAILSRKQGSERLHRDSKRYHPLMGSDQITTSTTMKTIPHGLGKRMQNQQGDRIERFYMDQNPVHRVYLAVKSYLRGDPKISKSVENIPLSSIRTPQRTVSKQVVDAKIHGDFEDDQVPRLPIVIRHQDGSHTLMDGNHRVQARAYRGFSHIRAHVVKEEDLVD